MNWFAKKIIQWRAPKMFSALNGYKTRIAAFGTMLTGGGLVVAGFVKLMDGEAGATDMIGSGWAMVLAGLGGWGLAHKLEKMTNGGVK